METSNAASKDSRTDESAGRASRTKFGAREGSGGNPEAAGPSRASSAATGPEIEIVVPQDYVPQGEIVGVSDEYGTIWAGEPGASERIGDLVARSDEETAYVYIDLGKVRRGDA